MKLNDDVKNFLEKQHFVIVSTLDDKGNIHTSAKGIIQVESRGKIFLLDIYKGRTYRNIRLNPNVTVTAIDERRFRGYSVEGKARILREDNLPKKALDTWHEKLARRIARRVISHVKEGREEKKIPEASFPFPKYIIDVTVDSITDLAPREVKDIK